MNVVTLDGLSGHGKNICGLAGVSADSVTEELKKKQSELIYNIKSGKGNHSENIRELRKIRSVILMNGLPERNIVLRIMPFIYDVNKDLNYVYKSEADRLKAIELVKLIRAKNNISGLGAGGPTWSKDEAINFAGKLPGKVDTIRTVVSFIINQDQSKVVAADAGKFAGILQAARENGPVLEARWKEFQYRQKGGTAATGTNGKSLAQIADLNITISQLFPNKLAVNGQRITFTKGSPDSPRMTLDQANAILNQYALKDANNKPTIPMVRISGIMQDFEFNAPVVEIQKLINNGYWLQMVVIPGQGNDGFDSSLNRSEAKFQYEKIEDLENWAKDSARKLKDYTNISTGEQFTDWVEDNIVNILNPAVIVKRASILLAFSTNFRNLARRSYIAYMSPQEASVAGYNQADIDKSKEIKVKIDKFWKNVGGNQSNLDEAINKGRLKNPWFDNKGIQGNLGGEGDSGQSGGSSEGSSGGNNKGQNKAALIIAIIGAISAIFKWLKDSGISFKKKESDNPDDNENDLPPTDNMNWQEMGFSSEQEYNDYVNGNNVQGSFKTGTIESLNDFINFIKASMVFLLAASFYPKLLIPINLFIIISLIYSLRNKFHFNVYCNSKRSILNIFSNE